MLNDESHHVFNKSNDKDIKKWREFLLNPQYNFAYIVGFTGTAYIDNEYFNDVVYRYSLRQAVEDRIVKNIEYVHKDDSEGFLEKFQKIYQNHQENKTKYPQVKPLSILITKDISAANNLRDELVDYLVEKEQIFRETIEKKVLIVTSHSDHKANLFRLKSVDDKQEPTEWIISVSMLTEGWDVKNVFQIVPWEDRAFNSKLLIAQVLGRGLRVPEEYRSPQPKVIVFNHDAWSKSIKTLVDEVLEIETRIESVVLNSGDRSRYHFEVYNIDYSRTEIEVEHERTEDVYDYSRIEREGIKLESQIIETMKGTSYELIDGSNIREKQYSIQYQSWSIDEIVDRIYDEFSIRDWEGRVLRLGQERYTQNNLPPRDRIKDIIKKSMVRVGIDGDQVISKNVQKILQAFATLLRKKGKTVRSQMKVDQPINISSESISKESTGVGNLRRGSSLFYTNNYEYEIYSEDQRNVFNQILGDESLPRSAVKEQNEYLFKTPVNIVITNAEPERKFVEYLCRKDIAASIDGWLKSRDRGFYGIEYSWRKGEHQKPNRVFNPDFFIKISKNDLEYFLVTEIKSDQDDSEENKAKYRYAVEHFARLNLLLETLGVNQKYIFHFLSPNGYTQFFEYLKKGVLLEGQDKFRCELENMLEE